MIVPLLHRILVKQDLLEEKDDVFKRAKAAGLDIGFATERDREQAAVDTGTVVAIGETAFRDFGAAGVLKIGDYIWFAKHAGKVVHDPVTDERFVALNDEDVVCLFTKEKEPLDG